MGAMQAAAACSFHSEVSVSAAGRLCHGSMQINRIGFVGALQSSVYGYSEISQMIFRSEFFSYIPIVLETSVYKGYKRDKIEMRVDRVEVSDFPLYLNTVAGGLDRRDQTIGGFSFVVKIYAVPVVEIIG